MTKANKQLFFPILKWFYGQIYNVKKEEKKNTEDIPGSLHVEDQKKKIEVCKEGDFVKLKHAAYIEVHFISIAWM